MCDDPAGPRDGLGGLAACHKGFYPAWQGGIIYFLRQISLVGNTTGHALTQIWLRKPCASLPQAMLPH
jgi:hypothetical protein